MSLVWSKAVAAGVLVLALAACSAGGGGTMLPAGVTTRMDVAGAQLDRPAALGLVNAFRGTAGAGVLTGDGALDAEAQRLAEAYAASGRAPRRPGSASVMLLSAGYADFANVFSGWRATAGDAKSLAAPGSRAGLGVAYRGSSEFGLYWVLLLAP